MDSQFNLRDRTVLIAADLSPNIQTLIQNLTLSGADCVLFSEDIKFSEKFAQVSNEMREVNDKYGRCGAVKAQYQSKQSVHEGIQDAVKIFGGIDAVIDASFSSLKVDFFNDATELEAMMGVQLTRSIRLVHETLPFLKTKKKARLIGLGYEMQLNPQYGDVLGCALRGGLPLFYQTLARELQSLGLTANWVTMGVTEEYLLKNEPQSKSVKESLEKLKQKNPEIRLLEPERLANMILFLLSPAGQGMTGQILNCK